MNGETAQVSVSLPDKRCAYERCGQTFTPRVEWQTHCRKSHTALDYQARKLKKAVDAEVARRLEAIQVKIAD